MNASEIRATGLLGMIFALRMLGLFMIIPVFSIYGQQYAHATPMLIGIAIGIYGFAQAMLQIPVSMLAEKYPRQPIIIVGLLLFIIGGAIAGLATDIWQVILGRFIAGAGAISAVIMALLADITREQSRSKAMAMMGFTIGGSIFTAFLLGPILVSQIGISGLFWLTSIAGILAIGLVMLVPTPLRTLSYHIGSANVSDTGAFSNIKHMLTTAVTVPNVRRLYMAVFCLHLLMTAIFVLIPINLTNIGINVSQHSWVYLPLLLVGFVLSIPFIIMAEAKRKMRQVFIMAMFLIALGLVVVALVVESLYGIMVGLAIFFIGFNLMEAMIPSWLSKQAPITVKNTVMGVSSSSQFLGAFAGGSLGGFLLTQPTAVAWYICAGVALLAVIFSVGISHPPYLSSLTASIPKDNVTANSTNTVSLWQEQILQIAGVEDMVLLPSDGVAYIKIDKQKFTESTRQSLSDLINQPLDFKIKKQ